MTTRKPNPIALAIVRRVLSYAPHQPPCSPANDEWHCDGCQLIVECADDNFDDLLPDPERPVLSDETIDWLYVHCDLFDVSRPLSSAIDDGGKVPLTLVATRLRDELRAWEEWRKKMEGEK